MHKLRLLLDSCDDFRRGCLSATRWTTQFKSLINKGDQKSLLQPKSWSTALCCYTYLMTCLPRFKPLLFVSVLHTIPVSMNSKGPGRHKSFTHFEHRAGEVGWERFGALNSSPHPRIFTSLSDGSSPHSYLFTSATGRIGVHTTPKYGTKPIRYVTLYFRDRLGAASLCHRNCASTSVPVCEQKPYAVWFSWRRKSCAV